MDRKTLAAIASFSRPVLNEIVAQYQVSIRWGDWDRTYLDWVGEP